MRRTERIRPAAPARDVVQIMNLVRLRIETLALEAGVTAVCVTGRSVRVAAVQQGLFVERPSRDRAAAERALAQIRAEFGGDAVVRARLVEAHLPEARFAWEPAGTVPAPEPIEVACPPMVRRIETHASALRVPSRSGWAAGALRTRPDPCASSPARISSPGDGGARQCTASTTSPGCATATCAGSTTTGCVGRWRQHGRVE